MTKPQKITLDFSPLPWQAEVIRAFFVACTRFLVLNCGRRCGKTTTLEHIAVRQMLTNPNYAVLFTSPVWSQSRARYREVEKILRSLGGDWIISANKSQLRLELSNGSTLQCVSLFEYNRVRGEGYDLILCDEDAYAPANAWHEALRPSLSDRQGRAIFASTPRGKHTLHHTLWCLGQGGDPEWKSWTFPTSSNGRIPPSEIEAAARVLPHDTFEQEYNATFLESCAGVFRNIAACIGGRLEGPQPGRTYVAGIDLGAVKDYSVVIVIDVARRQVVHMARFRGDFSQQVQQILSILRRYNGALGVYDETGLGRPVGDFLRNEMNGHSFNLPPLDRMGRGIPSWVKLQGVTLSGPTKMDLVQKLQLAVERQQIHWPKECEILTSEMGAYGYEMLSSGRVTYAAPAGFHDDAVTALFLGTFALTQRAVEAADPVMRLIDRAFIKLYGHRLYPLCTGSGTAAPYRSMELSAARLRRRRDLGEITQEQYAEMSKSELPIPADYREILGDY